MVTAAPGGTEEAISEQTQQVRDIRKNNQKEVKKAPERAGQNKTNPGSSGTLNQKEFNAIWELNAGRVLRSVSMEMPPGHHPPGTTQPQDGRREAEVGGSRLSTGGQDCVQ